MAARADIQVFQTSAAGRAGRRTHQNTDLRIWTEGSSARALQPVRREEERQQPAKKRAVRSAVPRMNIGYVMFLTFTAVIMVTVCAFYLKLQYRCTTLQKSVTALQSGLASMKLENDEEYNRIMSTVNLEKVKEDAMVRLGMVYAYEDQIVKYETAKEDYVKQYQEIPD